MKNKAKDKATPVCIVSQKQFFNNNKWPHRIKNKKTLPSQRNRATVNYSE